MFRGEVVRIECLLPIPKFVFQSKGPQVCFGTWVRVAKPLARAAMRLFASFDGDGLDESLVHGSSLKCMCSIWNLGPLLNLPHWFHWCPLRAKIKGKAAVPLVALSRRASYLCSCLALLYGALFFVLSPFRFFQRLIGLKLLPWPQCLHPSLV